MAYDLVLATAADFADRFSGDRAARPSAGMTGETLLKINHNTGTMTYGAEGVELEPGHRFVVPVNGFRYGYVDWRGGKPVDRRLTHLGSGVPTPEPPGGQYVRFPEDGPRKAAELLLMSIEERGFQLAATCSQSSANRMDNLAVKVEMQLRSPEGQAGFRHPVIEVQPDHYYDRKSARTIWHFSFPVIDWIHDDGETLLSQRDGGAITKEEPGYEASEDEVDFLS